MDLFTGELFSALSICVRATMEPSVSDQKSIILGCVSLSNNTWRCL